MNLVTCVEGPIGRITLDHPPLNILTRALLADLRAALTDLGQRSGLRVLVLSATGRHFSAGADVSEHLPPTYAELIPEFMDTIERVAAFPLPVVAAVQGRCLGGGFELAMAADVILAGETATFGQPEIALGVTAPAACVLLPRRGFPGFAAETLFTGDPMSAAHARLAGFVQHVVHDDQVEFEALRLAGRIARHSGAALRETKRALAAARVLDRADALHATGRMYVGELMRTEDAAEGLAAFVDRRAPAWKDR
jgi:cyclohexa-1,5-dienecarbonyl-CoA hydratase